MKVLFTAYKSVFLCNFVTVKTLYVIKWWHKVKKGGANVKIWQSRSQKRASAHMVRNWRF